MKPDKTSLKNYSLVMITIGAMAFVATPGARAQEITKYPSGLPSTLGQTTTGFICEGNIQDKGDNRIYCTGPIYRADEYVAKYARQSSDQLGKLNAVLEQLNTSLDKLNRTSEATQDVLSKQVQAFNNDLRAYIEKRFQDLSKAELQSAAIKNLKKSLMDYVDQRLKTSGNSPPPGPAAP
jgi:hypothetical protein